MPYGHIWAISSGCFKPSDCLSPVVWAPQTLERPCGHHHALVLDVGLVFHSAGRVTERWGVEDVDSVVSEVMGVPPVIIHFRFSKTDPHLWNSGLRSPIGGFLEWGYPQMVALKSKNRAVNG